MGSTGASDRVGSGGRRLAAGVGLGLSLIAAEGCREEPDPPPSPCGVALEGCGERMHCDRVAVPPRCVCDAAYTGSDCSSCALGYTRSGGRCVAQPIDCQSDPCGRRGQCISTPDGGECRCEEGYAGVRCATCADGYQDNDNDGVCRPACGVAPLVCSGRSVCSDASGVARCACPNGYTGERCDECEVGYRRLPGVPECVPTCASPDVACAEHGECIEGPAGAECVCWPGWGGSACDECAIGYTQTEAGECVAPIPDDADVLTVMQLGQTRWLAALSRPSWEPRAVAVLDRPIDALAYDAVGEVLYGLAEGELVRIDVATGQTETVAAPAASLGSALAFDSTRGLLYAASDAELFEIDPGGPSVSSLAARGAVALAYDVGSDRLLLLERVAGTEASLHQLEWDPETAELAEGGPVGLPPGATELGLAVAADTGAPHLLVGRPEDPTDALGRHCRSVARAMTVDADGSVLAGAWGDPVAAGESRTLSDSGSDPPLLVYGSAGDPAAQAATLRVETRHPDAVVCIVTERQPLQVVVAAEARLRLLVVSSTEGPLEVTVESGFEANPLLADPIRTHVEADAEPAVDAPEGLWVHHDAAGWAELGQSPFGVPSSLRSLSEIGPLDWTAGASSLRAVDTEGADLIGALTATPGVP